MLMLFITCLPSEAAVSRVLPAEQFVPELPTPPQAGPSELFQAGGLILWHILKSEEEKLPRFTPAMGRVAAAPKPSVGLCGDCAVTSGSCSVSVLGR